MELGVYTDANRAIRYGTLSWKSKKQSIATKSNVEVLFGDMAQGDF